MTSGMILCIEHEEAVRSLYERVAREVDVPVQTVSDSKEATIFLPQASLLVVNGKNVEFARTVNHRDNYLGKVLIAGGTPLSGSYSDLGVHEIWSKPISIDDLTGLFVKYTSPKARILCIDDEKPILSLLEYAVEKAGGIPLTAESAEEAIPHLVSAHAVISDVNQSGSMGGYGLLARARKLYDGEQLPFTLMSGKKFEEDKVRGATMLLQKPITVDALIGYISSMIPQHLRPRDAA